MYICLEGIASYYSNSVFELFAEGYIMIKVLFMAKETFSSKCALKYLCSNKNEEILNWIAERIEED